MAGAGRTVSVLGITVVPDEGDLVLDGGCPQSGREIVDDVEWPAAGKDQNVECAGVADPVVAVLVAVGETGAEPPD